MEKCVRNVYVVLFFLQISALSCVCQSIAGCLVEEAWRLDNFISTMQCVWRMNKLLLKCSMFCLTDMYFLCLRYKRNLFWARHMCWRVFMEISSWQFWGWENAVVAVLYVLIWFRISVMELTDISLIYLFFKENYLCELIVRHMKWIGLEKRHLYF
jgi:hypothetical protein